VVARDRDRALQTGALVRIKPEFQARSRYTRPGAVLVVIADKFDIVNVMDLGGGMIRPKSGYDSRAYARVPSTWVEVLDPAEFLDRFAVTKAGLKMPDPRPVEADDDPVLTEVDPPRK
jgi:hypothetical protein